MFTKEKEKEKLTLIIQTKSSTHAISEEPKCILVRMLNCFR